MKASMEAIEASMEAWKLLWKLPRHGSFHESKFHGILSWKLPRKLLLDRGTSSSPNLPYFCMHGSSGWAGVIVLAGEPRKGLGSRMLDTGTG